MKPLKIPNPVAWLAAVSIAVLVALPLNGFLAPASSENTARDLNLFHQVRERINRDYYRQDINSKKLLYDAIDGMVGHLDRNSRFFQPKAARDFEERNKGEFGGLGIYISIEAGKLIVLAPMPDSPAIKAGIRAGDIITHVDGKELPPDINTVTASGYLKGPRFSNVTVRVQRWRTGEVADIIITRDRIRVPSVENVHMLAKAPGLPSAAYLHLRQFQQNSERKFIEKLGALIQSEGDFDSLILDFRNNPGGDLEVATSIIDFFLEDEGALMLTQAERDDSKQSRATADAPLAGIPVCILINRHSASASELVACALRDHGAALLVGERTHGKGSVQTLYEFRGYDEVLKLTTALYYSPNGHSPDRGANCHHEGFCHHKANDAEVNRGGFRPDLEMPLTTFEAPVGDILDFVAAVSMPSMGQAFQRLTQRRAGRYVDLEVEAAAKLLGSPEKYQTLMEAHD